MAGHRETINAVYDLIRIQNARLEEYRKILYTYSLVEVDLKYILGEIIRQGDQNQQELTDRIAQLDGHKVPREAGAVYNLWADNKPAFGNNSHRSVLEYFKAELKTLQDSYVVAQSQSEASIRKVVAAQTEDLIRLEDSIRQYYNAL
jgi:hypothetical protein